ncbi:MAG: iron ABC transporter permease [Pseudomonadota bacterium]
MTSANRAIALQQAGTGGAGLALVCLSALAVALACAELALGPVSLTVDRVLAALAGDGTQVETAIVWQIRLPRLLLGLAVGVALGLAGTALQGLLRNPLAEPGLIGVTAGASLGAVSVIVLGGALTGLVPAFVATFMLPIGAFVGGAIVITVLFALALRTQGDTTLMLILAGVAINAIVGAAIGVLVYISDDQQLRDLTFWTMGSLATSQKELVLLVLALTGLMVPVFLSQMRALDLMRLGERAAFHSGLDVRRARLIIAASTALAVGAVTSAAGPIGFIGLVAPHLARLLVGQRHMVLLPAAAILGICLVLAADLAVRLAVPPAEPPIALATSIIGGPFFLWLLLRRSKSGGLRA